MLKKHPFYIKATVILFGLVLFVYSLSVLKAFLVPLCFGLMLAVLLNPLVGRLQKRKLPKTLAISIVLLLAIVVLVALGYFLSAQVASFSDQWPVLKKKFLELVLKLQHEISHLFNINTRKQDEWINEAEAGMKPGLGQALVTVAGSVETILLIPLYSFLFLFYKTLILNFLYEIFAEENSKDVGAILTQTKHAIQRYMFGLLLEALIVATLNSVALMILGVEYAILLGVLGAILNVLPFIGGIIAVLLPLTIATITKDGFGTQLGIIICYLVIQFIDNHFLVPYIVSSKVKINALISLIIVLLGGAVWGIPGMFLSIPFIGVLKIIFDRIPELKPWGKLLGDEVPTRHKGQIWGLRRKVLR
ncbi:MAG: AI-2E family transporter [Bacteroidota bacterium]|nr:AI-2E family transporter [Bacteroidota bacterium]